MIPEAARGAQGRLHRRALLRAARDRAPRRRAAQRAPPRPAYAARRERIFIVALNCDQAGGTCFCVSMETGPARRRRLRHRADRGARGRRHCFLVEAGSEAGAEVLAELATQARRRGGGRGGRPRDRARRLQPGPRDGHDRHQGAALPQLRAPALGRGRRPLPDLRQLHDGLPDLLLHTVEDVTDLDGRDGRAPPGVGLLLHDGLLLRPRRQRALVAASRATGSG